MKFTLVLLALCVSAKAQVLRQNGSSASSIAASSVTVTGLAANSVVFTRSGGSLSAVSTFSYTTGGNVGIGVSSPLNLLHLNFGTNLNWYFGYPSNGTTSLAALNDARAAYIGGRIDADTLQLNGQSAGNVGVNDTTPDALFEVKSNKGAADFAVAVSSQNDVTGNIVSVLGNGNVGIGVVAPSTKLSVYGVITSSTPAPSISCNAGTGVVNAVSTDQHGRFVAGAAAASCTLTFTTAYPKIPSCWCNDETAVVVVRAVATTTTIACDVAVTFGGDTVTYGCQAAP